MAFYYSTFSICLSTNWQLSIGDPTITGWAICAVYALAAVLAILVLCRVPFQPSHQQREQLFWVLIAGLMTAVAVNKQLDLQTLILTAGRCLSQEQGWYEDRRLVQRDFILALIALATVWGAAMVWLLRGLMHRTLMPLLGLVALSGFVVIKGGYIFHLFVPDQYLADYLLHIVTSLLELLGPTLIIASAALLLRKWPE